MNKRMALELKEEFRSFIEKIRTVKLKSINIKPKSGQPAGYAIRFEFRKSRMPTTQDTLLLDGIKNSDGVALQAKGRIIHLVFLDQLTRNNWLKVFADLQKAPSTYIASFEGNDPEFVEFLSSRHVLTS